MRSHQVCWEHQTGGTSPYAQGQRCFPVGPRQAGGMGWWEPCGIPPGQMQNPVLGRKKPMW